jgi:hypothetical protein
MSHMTTLQIIGKIGSDAVKSLRLKKLSSGRPFMINSKNLEPYQCYLEYPDGSIQLVFLKNSSAKEFTVIRDLSPSEELSLRNRYGLPRL